MPGPGQAVPIMITVTVTAGQAPGRYGQAGPGGPGQGPATQAGAGNE